ncbi:MAG TPA: hypothetical protein VK815_09255, partial [Candidatus Acidoferrales bacterium]|nr:hypothetical protein [Candidatus Acidoferrales bacterium]
MKNNVYQSTILLCLLLAASPAPAWTITNITVGVDSNSAAWGKVNLNNNNFTGWLNDHEGRLNTNSLTVSNLNSSLTNLAALGLVTNHQSGVTLSGTFSNSTFAGNGTYLTSLNGASLTAGTVNSNKFDSGTLALFGGGGPLRFSSSPLVITATNGQLFLTGGTNAFNGNGTVADLSAYDITNHVGRGLQFQGYGGGSFGQFPVNFIGHGGDGDNVSVKFIADGDLRFEPNEAGGGGKLSCAPANFGIDFPGVGNGAFFVDTTGTGFTGINQPSPSYQLDVGGTFACDNAQIYSDGGGNLTAQTFNPV